MGNHRRRIFEQTEKERGMDKKIGIIIEKEITRECL